MQGARKLPRQVAAKHRRGERNAPAPASAHRVRRGGEACVVRGLTVGPRALVVRPFRCSRTQAARSHRVLPLRTFSVEIPTENLKQKTSRKINRMVTSPKTQRFGGRSPYDSAGAYPAEPHARSARVQLYYSCSMYSCSTINLTAHVLNLVYLQVPGTC